MLDLSKIEAGQLTLALADYSMQEVVSSVHSAVESLAKEKHIALKVELTPDLPLAHGDERKLTQVLLNLVAQPQQNQPKKPKKPPTPQPTNQKLSPPPTPPPTQKPKTQNFPKFYNKPTKTPPKKRHNPPHTTTTTPSKNKAPISRTHPGPESPFFPPPPPPPPSQFLHA